MNIKQKSQEIKGKYNKLKTKAINEGKRLAVATVLIQFILAIAFFNLAKTDIFNVFHHETLTIHNVQASTEPQKEEKTPEVPETVKETIERVAEQEGFDDIELLLRIAECESGLDRYAKNPNSSARGIFQILDMHELTADERYNPEISTEWTIEKIREQGTRPWNASKHCWNK